MNRATKGKTLVGALDVRDDLNIHGDLYIKGQLVQAGGGEPTVYEWQQPLDWTLGRQGSQYWTAGIYDQNFIDGNGFVVGDRFDVSYTAINIAGRLKDVELDWLCEYEIVQAKCVYDMMWNHNVIRIIGFIPMQGGYGYNTNPFGAHFYLKKK